MAPGEIKERVYSVEKDLGKVERQIERIVIKLEKQTDQIKVLAKKMDTRHQREEVIMAALDIRPTSNVGERGSLEDIDDSILRLEDYLLAMGERVQRILEMLQGHREFLDQVDESVVQSGRRERMRLELNILLNSISILAMAGIEIDPSIPAEVDELRRSMQDNGEELEGVRSRKQELEQRLEGAIKKYDLSQLFAKKKDIPGYG
ncbi:MAG: hypothetical protein V3U52_08740 [Thermoplasmata archaeon]